MILRKMIFIILLLSSVCIYGNSWEYTWNIGTVDLVFNHFEKNDEESYKFQKLALSLLDFQFGFFDNRILLQTSLFQSRSYYEKTMYTLLPVEMNIALVNLNPIYIGIYGKGEIDFEENNVYPYYEYGIKIWDKIKDDPNKIKYSWKNAIYFCIDRNFEINIGLQLDIGIFGLLLLTVNTKEEDL